MIRDFFIDYSSTSLKDKLRYFEWFSFRRKRKLYREIRRFLSKFSLQKSNIFTQTDEKLYIRTMKFLFLFLLSIFSFAQTNDTINLNEFQLMDYSKYKQFRPKYKKVTRLTDHTTYGIKVFSTLQLPHEREIEIVAIEILFESKIKKKNYCNEYYHFKPIILSDKDSMQSLIGEKWFQVDKDYAGKYIFLVHLKIKSSDAKNFLIGYETHYENPFCPEGNGYFDLIETKSASNLFYEINNQLLEQNSLKNHAINYRLYYK